jgi:hypothetical protein
MVEVFAIVWFERPSVATERKGGEFLAIHQGPKWEI